MRTTVSPLFSCVMMSLCLAGQACAQVVPTTPSKFSMKPVGGTSASAGIASAPKPAETVYRLVTYVTLSQPRQWKSNDGKSVLGKLIAFEDIVVESRSAAPDAKAAPTMPAKITVVRAGTVRLLVDSKPFEVALDRLGEDERKFIQGIDAGVKAKATQP